MRDLLTISITNWVRARDAAEKEHRPMVKLAEDPSRPVFALPEMSIGQVDCEHYELLHVRRMEMERYTGELPVGRFYSICPYQPYAKHVDVIEWGEREGAHPSSVECKACRMACQCNSCRKEEILPQETVLHIGPQDVVKYQYHQDGSRTVTVRYERGGDD